MENNESNLIEHENVNGFALTLKMETWDGAPNSRLFTISYSILQNTNSSLPKYSVLLAVIFNMIALSYVRISVLAMLLIIIVFSFLVFFWISHTVQSESLLVIPTVGVRSTVKYVHGKEEEFVPWASIDDVIINEVVRLNRVLYYLTILTKNRTQSQGSEEVNVVPLFKHTKPRLATLEVIYGELQTMLTQIHVDETEEIGSGDIG